MFSLAGRPIQTKQTGTQELYLGTTEKTISEGTELSRLIVKNYGHKSDAIQSNHDHKKQKRIH
jgi:hypothetical protein